MHDVTLGVPDRRIDQAAVTRTRVLTNRRRTGLAIIVLLHGLAHANAGTWPGPSVPLWLTSVLWGTAMLGYLGAAFGLFHVPVVRRVYRPLMTAATMGSIALLTMVGGPIAFVGIAMDLVFLTLVIHWARVGESVHSPPLNRHPKLVRLGQVVALLFLGYATLLTLVHPIYLTWGTTATERAATLPGDDLVPGARYRLDHAITIRAPVDSVWPWLVQLGQDRGGFYSYAWLERLIGDDVHNADRIHPEWQRLKPGDLVRATQPDYLGGRFGELGWPVRDIVPGRAIILENWGAFVVQPLDTRTTRFFIRTRGDGAPSLAGVLLGPLNAFVFEPAHFIMQRGMMRGVRERAESMMGG
jgi:hypothetical protein